MPGRRFHLAADDILQLHLTLLYIKTIHIDMIHSLIRYQQKHAFLVKMLLGVLFLCLAAIIVWGAVR